MRTRKLIARLETLERRPVAPAVLFTPETIVQARGELAAWYDSLIASGFDLDLDRAAYLAMVDARATVLLRGPDALR